MEVTIECKPSYSVAYCHLDTNESVFLEPDAMVSMSDGVDVTTAVSGGVVKGLMRKMVGGESFFTTRYRAKTHGAWVSAAPPYPGDIEILHITPDKPYVTQTGSLLAFEEGVETSVIPGGATNVLAKEGITLLSLTGTGIAVVCSYGGFQKYQLKKGQTIVVDTGHLVAYEKTVSKKLAMVSSPMSSLTSGEMLVMRFIGPGEVYVQTRAEKQLRNWLLPKRAQNKE